MPAAGVTFGDAGGVGGVAGMTVGAEAEAGGGVAVVAD